MILHRPAGRGHPYLYDLDQRIPPQPVAGEPLEFRATTSADIGELYLELERGHEIERHRAMPLHQITDVEAPVEAQTHLSSAAAAVGSHGRPAWRVELNDLPADEHLRYRFLAPTDGARTRWFTTTVAQWRSEGGELTVEADGPSADRLIGECTSWLVADDIVHRVRFALRLEPREHVVGFGERFDALDQRGRSLDTVVFEQYKTQGNRTYLPMPFAIVPEGGFGFHVVTSTRVWFDVGAGESDRLWVDVELEPGPRPTVALRLFDGDPAAVLAAFLERTGKPILPPDWMFGPWMSGNEWNTQARVLAEVERSKQEGIPVSVVVIEAWSDESTFTAFRDAEYPIHPDGSPHQLADFRFPADGAWPDPKRLVETLHAEGIRVLLWQVPLLKARPERGSQLEADRRTLVRRGYAVRQADGRPYANRGWWFPHALLPDFTSSFARDWWLAKRRYLVEEIGVDGFKTDGGEHAWGDDLRYADGSTGRTTNNRYPVLYSTAYHQLFADLGRQGITFSRAGFTGAAASPAHWAGDENSTWEAFRASITAGLTAGASGILFWGWDISGFSGEIPTAELYLRAAAMACLCPIMQYHSEYNEHREPSRDRTPWNIAQRTGDPRVLPLYRRFARLRMRLVPYLYEQAQRSIAVGKPLMRAPFFDVRDDPRIWDFPYQYFLGDDLLVAPVVEEGARNWQVYLPAGEWVDVWSRASVTGPTVIERVASLDEIPVYATAVSAERFIELFADEEDD